MKTSLKAYYHSFSPRDRTASKLLLLGTPVLLYLLVMQPIYHYYQTSHQAYIENAKLLQWMRTNQARVSQAVATPAASTSNTDPVPVVNQLAEQHQITIDRLERQGKQDLRIAVQNAPFDNLTAWLNALQEAGARMDAVTLSRANAAGYASLQATFSFGSGHP